MKQLFILIIIFTATGCIAQVGYGPEIGIGMSTFKFLPATYPVLYTSSSVSPIIGGKVGGVVDVPLSKHTYFVTGFSFWRKGGKRSYSFNNSNSSNEAVHEQLYINYLELFAALYYKTGVQGKGRFIMGIGATPSYVAGGNNKVHIDRTVNGTAAAYDNNGKIVADKTVNGFDIGVMLTAGYELPTGLLFRTYYISGVSDIGIKTEVLKNRAFGVAVGYMLGKGRNINKETDDLIDKTP